MTRALRVASLLALAAIAGAAGGADAPSPALEARLKNLESTLRCLVCQNQTLADSSADLAADLRREVRELALSGRSDDQIRDYLVARYGDFVLYDPPFKRTTFLLWLGPFVLLGAGGLVWWRIQRRREVLASAVPADASAEARGRALLDDEVRDEDRE
ncbi:MAG TPA: cytochrome c-type biogenesis protein [Casimicrobiaceae bacterium]|nr:cytochrome c-type biogenesis protein [Casimicrobiaceae bacterium]